MYQSVLLSVALVASAANPSQRVDLQPCILPLWVTIADLSATPQIERDFMACGDGPVFWAMSEGLTLSGADLEHEESRFGEVSARVDGDLVSIAFRPRGSADQIEVKAAFMRPETVSGGRYRVTARGATGGPFVRAHAVNAPARDVALALARLYRTTLIGADLLSDEPLTLEYFRVPVHDLWEIIDDSDLTHLAYWPERNTVRLWRDVEPDQASRSASKSESEDAVSVPNLTRLIELSDATASVCKAGGLQACIAIHTQIVAMATRADYPEEYLSSESLMALIEAHRAANQNASADRADQQMAERVRSGNLRRLGSKLYYLRKGLDCEARQTVAALVEALASELDAMPPQQVRLSALAFDAMQLQIDASKPDATRRLRALGHRYFALRYDPDDVDTTPVDIGDDTLALARKSMGRSAMAIATYLRRIEAWGDASYALFLAEDGANDHTPLLQTIRMQRADAHMRLREPDDALKVVEEIECTVDAQACAFAADVRPALLLALNRVRDAKQALGADAGCAARRARTDALFAALEGADPPHVRAASDCERADIVAETVVDSTPEPDASTPWRYRLLAEAYASRYASHRVDAWRGRAVQLYSAAIEHADGDADRAMLQKRLSRLMALEP